MRRRTRLLLVVAAVALAACGLSRPPVERTSYLLAASRDGAPAQAEKAVAIFRSRGCLSKILRGRARAAGLTASGGVSEEITLLCISSRASGRDAGDALEAAAAARSGFCLFGMVWMKPFGP